MTRDTEVIFPGNPRRTLPFPISVKFPLGSNGNTAIVTWKYGGWHRRVTCRINRDTIVIEKSSLQEYVGKISVVERGIELSDEVLAEVLQFVARAAMDIWRAK